MSNKIAVIGAGKWGQALFKALSATNECVISSRTYRDMEGFVTIQEALKAPYLVIAIPSQSIAQWLEENFVDHGQKVLVAAKGIEVATGRFLNEIYAQHLDSSRVTFLSGPSFATEVMKSLPTALVVNGENEELAKEFASFFPPFMKMYVSSDVIGAEVAGAYKNVIAIASGIAHGLGLGSNAQASLITRGLAEMSRFGQSFGAKEQTFMGLSGVGDLCLTASSTMSRNYRVGIGLSENKTLQLILEELGEVAEGVPTAKAIDLLANKHSLYAPIAHEVAMILEGKDPIESLKSLLTTQRKEEEF